MGIKTQFSILSAVILVAAFVASPVAEAQRGRSVGKGASRAIRSGTSIGKNPAIRGAQGLANISRATRGQSSPFPVLDAISRAGSGGRNTGFPILDAISRASYGGGNYPSTPFPILEALSRSGNGNNDRSDAEKFLYGLSQLGGYGGGYGGYGPGYGGYGHPGYGGDPLYPYYNSYNQQKSQEDYADAMRDAAIAGAVGNVVSAIVQSPAITGQTPVYVQRQPVYSQPAPVYTQPAPAPYVQPNPLGRYETRREVVGGGYYEREQVWMPESRDPQSGNIVEGHYVTVKKWVPEVVQESSVWVAP